MAEVGKIDFKSIGERPPRQLRAQEVINRVPIGIRTPMRLGQSDGIYAMNTNLGDEIRQSLHNLILTNWGERLGRYQFGANLQELTMELGSEMFDEEVAVRIRAATNRWLPFVVLEAMERFVDTVESEPVAKIRLRIFYSVPPAGITETQALDVIFFIAA
jgi:phage baseplate assembly protein W